MPHKHKIGDIVVATNRRKYGITDIRYHFVGLVTSSPKVTNDGIYMEVTPVFNSLEDQRGTMSHRDSLSARFFSGKISLNDIHDILTSRKKPEHFDFATYSVESCMFDPYQEDYLSTLSSSKLESLEGRLNAFKSILSMTRIPVMPTTPKHFL